MKIQYASDLHLEMERNNALIKNVPIEPAGDILILAGDVCYLKDIKKHDAFFDYCSKNWKQTYWIPGNHEYYYNDVDRYRDELGELCQSIRENVCLLNNKTVLHDGVRIHFSTMWTKISESNKWYVQRGMQDFRLIKDVGEPLIADGVNLLHEESIRFLSSCVQSGDIVVTHHVPTLMNYPEKYKGSAINEGFAVEMFDFIEKHKPSYWIYGHNHFNQPDFDVCKTKLVTNQLCYVGYEESDFETKIIEL